MKGIFLELSVPLIVIIVFVLVQFPPGSSYLLLGHDAGFPLDLPVWFKNTLNVWSSIDTFGTNRSLFIGTWPLHFIEGLFWYTQGSIFTIQKLILIFWFFSMSVSYYVFVYSFYPERKYRWLRMFSSLFYILNFYLITRFRAYERTAFTMLIDLPLIITITIKHLQGKLPLITSLAMAGILFFVVNGAGIPPYWGLIWMVLMFTIVFHLLVTHITWAKAGKAGIFGFLLFVVFFVVNAYWVGPFFSFNLQAYKTVTGGEGFSSIVVWLREASKSSSLLNVLKLQGTDLWLGQDIINPTDFYMKNPLGQATSLIVPVLIFLPLLFAKKGKDRNFVVYFSVLSAIFIFLSAGMHEPLGTYFLWIIRNVPFFAIYRTPIYKFPYVVVFAYAFLFGFSMFLLIEHLRWWRRYAGIIVLFLFLAYNYLYIDHRIFKLSNLFSLRVQVPEYVLQAGRYINNKPQDGRVLMLPAQADNFGGVDLYTWGYSSLTPLPMLMLNKGIIGRVHVPLASAMISRLYEWINEGDWPNAFKYITLMNIHYLLLRKDVYYNAPNNPTDNPATIEQKLSEGNILLDHQFGAWKLYAVPPAYTTPHFYIPRIVRFINGDSYDFVNILSLLPSERDVAYYFSPADTTDQVPQLPYHSLILLPGNMCCTTFYKTGGGSKEYASLIDEHGSMTVFLTDQFAFTVPKTDRYTLFLRAGKPFSNADTVSVIIDGKEMKKTVAGGERMNDWIQGADIDLSLGSHTLSMRSDGQPIHVIKAGDVVLVSQLLPPQDVPSIEFQKINNTKYRLQVTNAKEPYIFVFSEAFDTEWKLYVDTTDHAPATHPPEIIASYDDGRIKERHHMQSVFNRDMLETWNLTGVPESRHVMLNGYANAWQILPQDAHGKDRYDMIIEYRPQRLFSAGILVSFASVTGFVVLLCYLTFKKYTDMLHSTHE